MRILTTLVLGGCAFLGGAAAIWLGPNLAGRAFGEPGGSVAELTALSDRFEGIARRLGPAVASVEAIKPAAPASGKTAKTVEDSGSGVIIAAEGGRGYLVLTNNHVISGARADQIGINLADGRLLRPSQVLADPESDIAALRVEAADGLPTAVLGDSDRVRVGQWVVAVGSPFGLSQSVTHGIISARERGQVSLGSTIRIKDFLQTDAAINPGSSGGPLLNLDGEVIGINTAIASQSGGNSGIAFAIPINLAKRVVRQLQERGTVARGYLGIQLAATFEPADAQAIGLDRLRGAKVEAVHPGTPAAMAGIHIGDVVLQVDSVAIRNDNHLINLISMLPAGQRVRVQLWRDRQVRTVETVVGDWADAQARYRAPAQ
jgi:S1-C subfamily serine protease